VGYSDGQNSSTQRGNSMTSKAMGLVGFVLILGTAYLMSNNRSKINYRLVISGLVLQLLLAIFVLKVEFGQMLFRSLGDGITQLLHFSDKGAGFVFGPLVQNPENLVKVFGPGADYIFAFRVVPTIIFVSSLVSISYFLGIMQKFVQIVAKIVSVTMGASAPKRSRMLARFLSAKSRLSF
jgi:CNT family concentrative nucleoside transporter